VVNAGLALAYGAYGAGYAAAYFLASTGSIFKTDPPSQW